MTTRSGIAASLVVYGLAHAVIDAISAGILLTLWHGAGLTDAGGFFVLYNLLAFGAQPLLGLAVDGSRQPRTAALVGVGLVAGSTVVFARWPLLGVILVGSGNALFHLGAGSIALRLTPGRATAPGIFVAPGALGLFLGTYLGQTGTFVAWPFVLALACLAVGMVKLAMPAMAYEQRRMPVKWNWAVMMLALLLSCIAVRALVGFAVVLPWKSVMALAVTLTVAVVLGKAVGGVLADRWGWGRIAVGALAVSTPLLAFGANVPAVAIIGLFLFNFAMPVTLAATANVLPGRPAFAFGLTCLALELGGWLVTQSGCDASRFGHPWIIFGMTLGAVIALYLALRLAFGRLPTFFSNVHE